MANSEKQDLKRRTKQFALDTIRFSAEIPPKREFAALVQQLIRCASSVGANYRAACRAQSPADFVSELSIVEEEADEAAYWLEVLEELGVRHPESRRLQDETDQLIAIAVASKKTARANYASGKTRKMRTVAYSPLDIRHSTLP
jgi:four helix bundle protein